MKYPIGIQSFDQIIEGNWVYVDKTDLVYRLVTTTKTCFLSRPRRFGKSLLVSTLDAYFKGRKELFDGLMIAKLEKDWHQYPVFKIDFNGVNFTEKGNLEATIEYYLANWEKIYGETPREVPMGKRFEQILSLAYQQTGRRAVVLVDEYDKPILDALDTPLEDANREILKAFYSTFKGADEYLRFVLLTGVTKFSQVSVFSGFNQPKDISMDNHYEALCGVTQVELEHYFAEPIANLAEKFNYTVEEMKDVLKMQYDGYHFGSGLLGVYNPFSLLNAFDMNDIRDYWFASGTPTYLIKLLRHNHEQMDELTGRYYDPSMFVDYKADVEKPLPMIYQSGYLTIKGYDTEVRLYKLGYPNDEVKYGFLNFITPFYTSLDESKAPFYIGQFVKELRAGDVEAFLTRLRAFFADFPYELNDKTERHYQVVFYLVFKLLGQFINAEVQSALGRADAVVKTANAVYVFEFKLNGTAEEALAQINNRGYLIPYTTNGCRIVKIGAEFSKEERNLSRWLVEEEG